MARRRNVLRSLGVAAATALAGCGGAPTDTKGRNNKSNNSSGSSDGSQPGVRAFVDELESAGVDVDDAMEMMGGLSVGYWYDPDHKRQDIVRTASVFADYGHLVDTQLTMTSIMPDGSSRHGIFYIPKDRVVAYNRGDLTEDEYLNTTVGTYEKV